MIYNIVDNTPTTMRVVIFEYVTVDGRQKTLIKTYYSIPINEAMKEDKKLRAMGHTHQDEINKEPVKTEAEIRAEIKAEMMAEMKLNVVPDMGFTVSQGASFDTVDGETVISDAGLRIEKETIVQTVEVDDVKESISKADLNPCDIPVEKPKKRGRPKKSS